MRMKFNKSGQLLMVSAASLLARYIFNRLRNATVDFVFVTSSKAAGTNNYGEIDVFEVNRNPGLCARFRLHPFLPAGAILWPRLFLPTITTFMW